MRETVCVSGRLGAVPIASHQVVMQLWLLASFIIDSLAIAGQTLVAVSLGQVSGSLKRNIQTFLTQRTFCTCDARFDASIIELRSIRNML